MVSLKVLSMQILTQKVFCEGFVLGGVDFNYGLHL